MMYRISKNDLSRWIKSIIRYYIPLTIVLLAACSRPVEIDLSENWKMKTIDISRVTVHDQGIPGALYEERLRQGSIDVSDWVSVPSLPSALTMERKSQLCLLYKEFIVPEKGKKENLSLYLGRIWDVTETYLNGVKIGTSGRDYPDFHSDWNVSLSYELPGELIRYGEKNVITIRQFSDQQLNFNGQPFIGNTFEVRNYNFWMRFMAEYLVLCLAALTMVVGFKLLLEYMLSEEKNRVKLHFGLLSILWFILTSHFWLPSFGFITWRFQDNLFYVFCGILMLWIYYILEMLLHYRIIWIRVILSILFLIMVSLAVTATNRDPMTGWRFDFFGIIALLCQFFWVYIIIRGIIERKNDAGVISIGIAVFILALIHDSLMMRRVIMSYAFLTNTAYPAIILSFAIIIARRSRLDLERKVVERTSELQIERNKLKYKNDIISHEIALARKIQDQLIPDGSPVGYICSLYNPMEEVGGDFFDFITFRENDKIGIFISDVSGHGVPAAFITSMIKTIMLQAGNRRANPAELLHYMNDILHNQTGGNFITSFYGIYDNEKKSIYFSNAGHYAPYIISDSQLRQLQGGKTTAIAMFSNSFLAENGKTFNNHEEVLSPGSKLLLFTDGLIETRPLGCDDLFFEDNGMHEVLIENSHLPCDLFLNTLYQRLVDFRGSESFDDDVCLICLDVK